MLELAEECRTICTLHDFVAVTAQGCGDLPA
jgi:hypothetical protein